MRAWTIQLYAVYEIQVCDFSLSAMKWQKCVKRWNQRADLLSMQSHCQQQHNTNTVRSLIPQWKELTRAFIKYHIKSSSSCLHVCVFTPDKAAGCAYLLSSSAFFFIRFALNSQMCRSAEPESEIVPGKGKNLIRDQHFNCEMLCEARWGETETVV